MRKREKKNVFQTCDAINTNISYCNNSYALVKWMMAISKNKMKMTKKEQQQSTTIEETMRDFEKAFVGDSFKSSSFLHFDSKD